MLSDKIVHCKKSKFDVYIGRAFKDMPASKWGNPFVIGKHGTREEVIKKYEEWIVTQPDLMAALPELKNKVLGCWCKPLHNCHGEVLTKLLSSLESNKSMEILPIFSSHYSMGDSILTLEECGKTAPGNPVSICDLAKSVGLKQVVLVDERIDSFIEAYKSIQKSGLAQLVYGLKLTVCIDMANKEQDSMRTESKVVIFIKNTQGYSDLIRIWNRAWCEGFFNPARDYGYGRIDWKTLKEFWTDNLALALPFFSSFIAKNTLTFANIVPILPVDNNQVTYFKEVDCDLPFVNLINDSLTAFCGEELKANIQPVKSIYYASPEHYDIYVTYRAIHNKSQYMKPEVEHLYSNRFSFEAWKGLQK